MTMSGRDLVTKALRTLGILGEDDEPTAGQLTDGLELLNEIVDLWSAQRAFLTTLSRSTFSLVAGQSSRTIGPSGNFSMTAGRPAAIVSAAVIAVGGTDEYPVKVLTRDEWAAIPDKATSGTWPYRLHYEPTDPNGTLYFYPVPSSAATLVLYTEATVSAFADATTEYSLPRGYPAALRLTLAEAFGPHFGAPIPPLVTEQARDARAVVKASNRKPRNSRTVDVGMPSHSGGFFDYQTGRFA